MPTLFPQGVVLIEYQSRLVLPMPIDSGRHRIFEHILDKMSRRPLPYQLRLALDGRGHRQRTALLMEPCTHLPDTPQGAQLPKHQRERFLHA
jgi:hypothetical protein